MNITLDTKWTFRLITDHIQCGPCYELRTDAHIVDVFKARDDGMYHICIMRRDKPARKIYESRYDSFYFSQPDPRVARDIAVQKLSRL